MVNALVYYRAELLEQDLTPPLVDGDGDSLDNDIVLDEGTNYLILEVTEQQYIELLSAALNGVKITYPENYIAVLYPLIKAGKLVFCDQVANCIDTNQGVMDAINNLISGNLYLGKGNPNGTFASFGAIELYNNPESCDYDAIYAFAIQMTDFINNVCVDFFQLLEAVTNDAEYVSTIISAIPIVGLLPVDEVIDLAQNYLENIGENYLAAYDEDLRREISCLVFCAVIDNDCYMTFGELANLFLEQFLLEFNTTDLQDIFDLVTQGIFAGDEFVYAMFTTVFALLGLGSEFLGLQADFVTKVFQAMSNDSDPDWEIYCEDCEELPFCVILDFDNPDGSPTSFCGTPSGEQLLTDNVLCDGAYWARFFTDLDPFKLTYFEIHAEFVGSNAGARFATALTYLGGSIDGYSTNLPSGGTPSFIYDNPSGTMCDNLQMYARNGTTTTPPTTNTARIVSVEIHGIGFNPFENATLCEE